MNSQSLTLQDFAYDLPETMIAQSPISPRDRAKLMVINRATGQITHDVFANIGDYLPENSVIVLNDSKVIPARILTRRATGGEVEIFLLKQFPDGHSFEVMLRPLRRLKNGEKISLNGNGFYAEITDKDKRIVRFNKKDIFRQLAGIGHIPLPPYIKRSDTAKDRKNYQTVYARKSGSIASPTAGLHFTKRLLGRLQKQHSLVKVTLHINYATFKPVAENDITQHKMHTESYDVSKGVWTTIERVREQGRKVVAVGTTSCRVLEAVTSGRQLSGETNIFMYPGYQFKMTDILVTNFHLPLSTLLMLVYAFGGTQLMKKAYAQAVRKKYRFYSYGDAMIII